MRSTVSVDHFESRQEGRTYTYESYGKSKSQYQGGCVFVDHASGYIHVEHQLGVSASETLRATHNYEKLALEHGVVVVNYLVIMARSRRAVLSMKSEIGAN
jgi:hypothetical protein